MIIYIYIYIYIYIRIYINIVKFSESKTHYKLSINNNAIIITRVFICTVVVLLVRML